MLVIHPDECIDCGVCEPECPVDAIKPDTEPGLEKWLEINTQYAQVWPNITIKREPPGDAKDWEGKPDKAEFFHRTLVPATENGQLAGQCQDVCFGSLADISERIINVRVTTESGLL